MGRSCVYFGLVDMGRKVCIVLMVTLLSAATTLQFSLIDPASLRDTDATLVDNNIAQKSSDTWRRNGEKLARV